jgi:hypothetical protein
VTTASTKSRPNKDAEHARAKTDPRAETGEEPGAYVRVFEKQRNWLIASGSVLAISAFVRLFYLSLNPLHHDEGVNGFFLTRLFNEHKYEYDPANYHGPTLYYFALAVGKPAEFLFGRGAALTTFGIRLVPALFTCPGISYTRIYLSSSRWE